MTKVLVTGGAGYIGSKIVSDLIKKKNKIFIIDNLSTGHRKLINKKAIFYKVNCGNKSKVNQILKQNNIKSIIHCAAFIDVIESEKKPKKYYNNNVLNTKKLLDECVKNKIKNFIFSSSCSVYGERNNIVSETTKTQPKSMYGKTKLECEKLIKLYSKKYNFNYGILRYFNVAGSDIENKIGCINKTNSLIKNLSQNIAKKKYEISVFGDSYNTKDGTCIRDFIDINDLSKIHLALLNIISKKNKSHTINCGYGKGYSVLDVIKNFEKELKIKIKINILPKRPADIIEIYSSNHKLTKLISINGKNKLKKIILSSVKWEKYLLKIKN